MNIATSLAAAPVEGVSDYTRTRAPKLLNVERLERLMQEAGIDILVASTPENVAYMSGYQCLTHWFNKGTKILGIYVRNAPELSCVITPALEVDAWAEQPPWIAELIVYGTSAYQIGRNVYLPVETMQADDRWVHKVGFRDKQHKGVFETFVEAIAARKGTAATIGVDEDGAPASFFAEFAAALPKARVLNAAFVWRGARMVKTPEEILLMKHSSTNAIEALFAAAQSAAPGMTERDLTTLYQVELTRRGSQTAFSQVVAGRRTAHPHTLPSDYALRAGDIVKYDVGGTYRYYYADVARMQAIGGASDRQAQLYGAILAGQQAGIALIRPGVRPSEVFQAAVATVRESGLPDYRRHHVGHGIGLELYDAPLIQPAGATTELSGLGNSDEPLEEGMVINIETPYYEHGEHGYTVEDTVVVTASGSRYLTDLPRDLIV